MKLATLSECLDLGMPIGVRLNKWTEAKQELTLVLLSIAGDSHGSWTKFDAELKPFFKTGK